MFRCWDRTRECSWRDDTACQRGLQYSYSLGCGTAASYSALWVYQCVINIIALATSTHHAIDTANIQTSRFMRMPLLIYNDESLHLYADGDITRSTKACREGLRSSYSASWLWKAPLGRGRRDQGRYSASRPEITHGRGYGVCCCLPFALSGFKTSDTSALMNDDATK